MEYENLIQAFSRTNRLYGDEKPFGIIKYYRRTHTMRRNIEIAVKAYSGDIPTGLFVDKLPSNLNSMNRFFDEIADLFKNAGIENFEKLPEERSEQRKFAKLFKLFVQRLEAAQIQGFNWSRDTYTVSEPDESESYIVMDFDYNTYLALLQRYKELPSAGGGGAGEEPPFEIDTHITEINTDAIDADYMNSRFDKFFRLLQQGNADKETLDQVLKDLHKSYSMLPRVQQKYANLFISDVQSGEITIDPTMTFRDYIALYMRKSEDARIARIVRRLGCYENLLRKLLGRKVTETNYKEFGYFDELVASVDKGKAKRFFVIIERDSYKDYRLNMYITTYLKKFVISGGVDPYADIIDSGRKSSKQDVDEHVHAQSGDSVVVVDTAKEGNDVGDVIARTTVKSRKLNQWYQSSQAVACMMNTGCFAYVEEKVCLDEPKYVERQESGKMRLTPYAKEHEEECFLQFKVDSDGNLHYVKLPESIADKEFRYSDYISEDILTRYGLVNEIANQMLAAIRDMEFGDALKELMSERICRYSVGLLKSTTGLDNHTISNMREGKNLTDVNVVSACLGIHLPFPVSNNMLELANLVFRMDKGPEKNKTYIQLLTLRWASDYSDIYDDLEEQNLGYLIKKPSI